MTDAEFGYEKPNKLAENLWEIHGQWENKLGRRMTVIRLLDGGLVLHSAFKLNDVDLNWLKSQGNVASIIAPNIFHCSDAGWMANRFPSAELYAPKSKLPFFERQGLHPKDVNSQFPSNLSGEVKCIPMEGTRIQEAAFVHLPTRTLILCDLAFNMDDVFTGLEKSIMKWNKVGGRFGPSKLTRLIFTKDKKALVNSYRELLKNDFDRIVVNHGKILPNDGKNLLKRGVEEIFGAF